MITILMPVKGGVDKFLLSLFSIVPHASFIKSIYIIDSSDTPLISQSSLVGEMFSLLEQNKISVHYSCKKLALIPARISLLRAQLDIGHPSDVLAFLDSDIIINHNSSLGLAISMLRPYSFVASFVDSPTNIAGYPNYVTAAADIKNTWQLQFAFPSDMPTHKAVLTAGLFCLLFNWSSVNEELLYQMERVKVREDMFFTRYLSISSGMPGVIPYTMLKSSHLGKTRKEEWDSKAFDRDQLMFDAVTDAHGLETLGTIF
jgi:hypothetical protein